MTAGLLIYPCDGRLHKMSIKNKRDTIHIIDTLVDDSITQTRQICDDFHNKYKNFEVCFKIRYAVKFVCWETKLYCFFLKN